MSENILGIQTYCFRKLKGFDELRAGLRECGLDAVELFRSHADCRKDCRENREFIDRFKADGMKIIALGVEKFTGAPEEENIFKLAEYAGADYVSADFSIDEHLKVLARLEALAGKYGVNVGIHNHGGKHWLGNLPVMRYIVKNSGPRIGFCLDTGWALDAGQNPLEIIEELFDRIHGLHLKDFNFGRSGKPEDTIIGRGNLDLPALLGLLRRKGYSKSMIIEHEGNPEDPIPGIKECIREIKAANNELNSEYL